MHTVTKMEFLLENSKRLVELTRELERTKMTRKGWEKGLERQVSVVVFD